MAGESSKLRSRLIMMHDFFLKLFFCSYQIITLPIYQQWHTEASWNSILPHLQKQKYTEVPGTQNFVSSPDNYRSKSRMMHHAFLQA